MNSDFLVTSKLVFQKVRKVPFNRGYIQIKLHTSLPVVTNLHVTIVFANLKI